jgi:hypothetical protein
LLSMLRHGAASHQGFDRKRKTDAQLPSPFTDAGRRHRGRISIGHRPVAQSRPVRRQPTRRSPRTRLSDKLSTFQDPRSGLPISAVGILFDTTGANCHHDSQLLVEIRVAPICHEPS